MSCPDVGVPGVPAPPLVGAWPDPLSACSFAVIATGCASCPKIACGRDGCDAHFCYHCKAEWHPNQTCDSARALRSPESKSTTSTFSHHARLREWIGAQGGAQGGASPNALSQ